MQITNSRYPTSRPERFLEIGVRLLCLWIDEHVIGAIGFRPEHRPRLIDRYHDLKKWEVGGNGMNYAIFPSSLKKKFKIGATRTIFNIGEGQFEILAANIQTRIRGTKLARMKPQQRYFVSFGEYTDNIASQVE